jgi:hypothetical protein
MIIIWPIHPFVPGGWIDHLEGLIKQEARQVDKLKGSLPPVSPTH